MKSYYLFSLLVIAFSVVMAQQTVEQWKAKAVLTYPDLYQADSAFNKTFVQRYHQLQQSDPHYFDDASWPMRLAKEVAANQQAVTTTQSNPNPMPPSTPLSQLSPEMIRSFPEPTQADIADIIGAVKGDNLEAVKTLLKKNPKLASCKGSLGTTPLHSAAFKGYKDIAELLIVNGANVNAKDDSGDTPLAYAAANTQPDMESFLLLNGGQK